jgi:crotonobetainyl-CoA:carnitine CoA-transferase CaiB-like acyl-CoA transferase
VDENTTGGPLQGIRVADFGHIVAGAGVGQVLAQLGADVFKIERLEGEIGRHHGAGGRPYIAEFNRGKRSLALDLRHPRGQEAALRLVHGVDVVVENMRPGAMNRLGLGYERVAEGNPRVIYASVSGFGNGGTAAKRAGLDTAAQAESGLMTITGAADGPPQPVGAPIIDVVTAHYAAQAILAALVGRGRSGKGDYIDVSLLSSAIAIQQVAWCEYFHTGVQPVRGGRLALPPPSGDTFNTLDGTIVLIAVKQEHWVQLCEVLGCPDLLTDPRFANFDSRLAHADELLRVLAEQLSTWYTDELTSTLLKHGLAFGHVRSYDEVLTSPEAQESAIFGTARTDEGGTTYPALNLPYRMKSWPAPELSGVDAAGGHSRQILRIAGLSDEHIEELITAGIVGVSESSAL